MMRLNPATMGDPRLQIGEDKMNHRQVVLRFLGVPPEREGVVSVAHRWASDRSNPCSRPGRGAPKETDCVAGHIGFELRCAKRRFISLTSRASSGSRYPSQTVAVSTGEYTDHGASAHGRL